MPSLTSILQRFTNQTLVYWQKTGNPDRFGKPSYMDPIPLHCLWFDKQMEVEVAEGRTVFAKAYILLYQPVIVGSLVMLLPQPLADFSTFDPTVLPNAPKPPTMNQGAYEVLAVKQTPGIAIRLQGTLYEAYC